MAHGLDTILEISAHSFYFQRPRTCNVRAQGGPMQKFILLFVPLFLFGCGQGYESKFLTEAGQSQLCAECNVDTTQIDAKLVEADKAVEDANAEMNSINPAKVILDPKDFLNGGLKKVLDKVRELLSKIDELEAKIDAHLAILDPALHADLIARLQKLKDRLAGVEDRIFAARDKLVAKVDVLIAKVESEIAKLHPLIQIALADKIEKLMKYLHDFRDGLAGLV